MRLVIFTPALKRSAIGRMNRLVTTELRRAGHEVTVVRTETASLLGEPTHDFETDVVSWTDGAEVRKRLAVAACPVYHIGNNHQFHEGALKWMTESRGLVCLHDFYLSHLFHGWAELHPVEAAAVRNAWCPEFEGTGKDPVQTRAGGSEGGGEPMMTEWVASQALGVLTHSRWGIEAVLSSCPGPVRVSALAYELPVGFESQAAAGSGDEFRILTLGHINANKRVESVIDAIGASSRLRDRTVYRLVGKVEPHVATRLAARARRLAVRLEISGEVEEDELAAAMAEADVISCLRWPTYEAASASAIEALLCGKPTLVTDAGFYGSIPSECVVKIRVEHEADELRAALESLAVDDQRRARLGATGRSWAADTFTGVNYADQLVRCIGDVERAEPLLDGIDQLVGVTSPWGVRLTPEDLDLERIGLMVSRSSET